MSFGPAFGFWASASRMASDLFTPSRFAPPDFDCAMCVPSLRGVGKTLVAPSKVLTKDSIAHPNVCTPRHAAGTAGGRDVPPPRCWQLLGGGPPSDNLIRFAAPYRAGRGCGKAVRGIG